LTDIFELLRKKCCFRKARKTEEIHRKGEWCRAGSLCWHRRGRKFNPCHAHHVLLLRLYPEGAILAYARRRGARLSAQGSI